MIKFILSLFGASPGGMVVSLVEKLMPLILAALVAGIAWSFGHSSGYESGLTEGRKEATAEYTKSKTELDKKITDLEDAKAATDKAQAARVAELEKDSALKGAQITVLQKKLASVVPTVITQYVHDNPASSQQCGLDAPAITSINSIIDEVYK